MKQILPEVDFATAAGQLSCPVAAIKAVCAVEAPRGGFMADGQPRILFERHHFSKLTGGKFDKSHPHISNRTPGGYGGEAAQHVRLSEAAALDREAALKSASWGKFQIMGSNYEACGFGSLQSFINAMYQSEARHLDAFIGFVKANPGMLKALRAQDWAEFARRYNGPNYAINKYDTKLDAAFRAAA